MFVKNYSTKYVTYKSVSSLQYKTTNNKVLPCNTLHLNKSFNVITFLNVFKNMLKKEFYNRIKLRIVHGLYVFVM